MLFCPIAVVLIGLPLKYALAGDLESSRPEDDCRDLADLHQARQILQELRELWKEGEISDEQFRVRVTKLRAACFHGEVEGAGLLPPQESTR